MRSVSPKLAHKKPHSSPVRKLCPDSKVHGANMGLSWVLSAPDGSHVGPMNLTIRVIYFLPQSLHWYMKYHVRLYWVITTPCCIMVVHLYICRNKNYIVSQRWYVIEITLIWMLELPWWINSFTHSHSYKLTDSTLSSFWFQFQTIACHNFLRIYFYMTLWYKRCTNTYSKKNDNYSMTDIASVWKHAFETSAATTLMKSTPLSLHKFCDNPSKAASLWSSPFLACLANSLRNWSWLDPQQG